jgi:hypothetical protein
MWGGPYQRMVTGRSVVPWPSWFVVLRYASGLSQSSCTMSISSVHPLRWGTPLERLSITTALLDESHLPL